jgi:hypothetical protein
VTTSTVLLPSREVPLQPKEVHARFVCFSRGLFPSEFNFCLSWQNFKVVFLNDGGELGPRPLSQEHKTTKCVDQNNSLTTFSNTQGGRWVLGYPGPWRTGGHTSGRYGINEHTRLPYGGMEETEGVPTQGGYISKVPCS